ncbi:malonyl-ACP O-methyltransferase BioC [Vibrio sp. TRT 21S02]|uniref:malonyl-ACP O-methyltransferase BioC n=1 Tax=Vibrio sp. TRT 21S02 TaxID=3418507 RepID=UPI003CEF461A
MTEFACFDLTNAGDQKRAIAEAFGKASITYDQHAAFQREVGHKLLDKMPKDLLGKRVLDLGCGTGYFSQQLKLRGAEVICMDLSQEMLQQSRQRCGDHDIHYHVGDAESIPLQSNSVDYVFSSLALQWCEDLSVPLKEMKRVLRSGGEAFFTTLLDGSLHELKKAWGKIDSYQHVNDFISINQVKIALAQADCHNHHLDLPEITVWYESSFSLMRDLKGIGANHVSGRSHGLTSRRALIQVEEEYQVFKNHQGLLPATYQVCLGVIHL